MHPCIYSFKEGTETVFGMLICSMACIGASRHLEGMRVSSTVEIVLEVVFWHGKVRIGPKADSYECHRQSIRSIS